MRSALDAFFAENAERKNEICTNTGGPQRIPGTRVAMPVDLPAFYKRGNGWDICELAWSKARFCSEKCCINCDRTASLNGQCWFTHYINYWLWGYLQKQCDFSIWDDDFIIWWHRYWANRDEPADPPGARGRQCWAAAGYDGRLLDPKPFPERYNRFHQTFWTPPGLNDCGDQIAPCTDCEEEYGGELTARIRSLTKDGAKIMYSIRFGRELGIIDLSTLGNPEAPIKDCDK
jgi:hypothetical protein